MAQAAMTVQNKGTLETILSGPTFQEALKTVLPKHLTPERVVKMALVAASRQPKLWQCTKESFLQAIMKSAELGLDCSGTLGRAYLVPYYNNKIGAHECQFIAGYQGLIELARRSGHIARIESRVVHENDFFEFEYGLDQKLIHKPNFEDAGALKCVYAIAELTDGSKQIEIMTAEEINTIRARSRAKDSGPWVSDYNEMARKTVIRRIAKYLPLSTEMELAFEADDQLFNGSGAAADLADRTKARVVDMKTRLGNGGGTETIETPAETSTEELPANVTVEEKAEGEYTFTSIPETEPPQVEPWDEPAVAENPASDEGEKDARRKLSEEDEKALKLLDLRKLAVERFRALEHDDVDAYNAAYKWLGSKTITELNEKKLNEFFEKFG